MIGAIQDFITGAYLLTQKDRFFQKDAASELAVCLLAGQDASMSITLPPPAIMKPVKLWTGKQIFSLIMRPSPECPIKANLKAKGRMYTTGEELCINDSCKLYIVMNYYVYVC